MAGCQVPLGRLWAAPSRNGCSGQQLVCADEQRAGLCRIADTLDALPYVTMANLSNLDAAMRGRLLDDVIEVYPDAVSFLAEFQSMIDMALKRVRH